MSFTRSDNRRPVPTDSVALSHAKVLTNPQKLVLSKNANSFLKSEAFQLKRDQKIPKASFNQNPEKFACMPCNTIKPINKSKNTYNAAQIENAFMCQTPISLETMQVTQPYWGDVISSNSSPNRGANSFQVVNPNSISKAMHISDPKVPILLDKYLERTKACFTGTVKSTNTKKIAVVSNKNAANDHTAPVSISVSKSTKNLKPHSMDAIKYMTPDPNAITANKTATIAFNLNGNLPVLLEQHFKQTQVRKILPTKSITAKLQNGVNDGHDFKPKISSLINKYAKSSMKKVVASEALNTTTNNTQTVNSRVSDFRLHLADRFNNNSSKAKISKTGVNKNCIKNSTAAMTRIKRQFKTPKNAELNTPVAITGESTTLSISSKLESKARSFDQCSRNTLKNTKLINTSSRVSGVKVNPLTKICKSLSGTNQQRSKKRSLPVSKPVILPIIKTFQNLDAKRKLGGTAIPHQNFKTTHNKNMKIMISPVLQRIRKDLFNSEKSVKDNVIGSKPFVSPVPKKMSKDLLKSSKSLIDNVIVSTPFAIVQPNVQPEIDQAKGTDSPQDFANIIGNMLRDVVNQYANLNSKSTKSFANALKNWMNSVTQRNLKIKTKRNASQKLSELIDRKNREFAEITKKIKHLNFSKSSASLDFENNYKRRAAIHADTEMLIQKYRKLLKSGCGNDLNWALTNENLKNVSIRLEEDPLLQIVRICEAHGQTNAANVIRELAKGL